MSVEEMEKARHAEERGAILRALAQDYRAPKTTVRSLARALDLLGYSMTVMALEFSLVYLAEQGYIQIWRARDVPGFRPDRARGESGDGVAYAHLLPKGLWLIDGEIEADRSVSF